MAEEIKLGRPTTYRPEYDEMLIEHMSEGMSFESFAGLITASRSTIYLWLDNNPSFSDARKIGLEKCRFFWEKIGVAATVGKVKDFNVTCWIFNMKNRFQWADRTDVSIESVKPTMIERLDGRVIELGIAQNKNE